MKHISCFSLLSFLSLLVALLAVGCVISPGTGSPASTATLQGMDAEQNQGGAEVPGVANDAQRPGALPLSGPAYTNTDVLSLSYDLPQDEDADAPPLSALTLWTSRDNGRTWSVAMRMAPPEDAIKISLPDGRWGFYLAGQTADGPEPAAPQTGTAPALTVVVDRKAPAITIGTMTAARTAADILPEVDNFTITIPYAISEPHPAALHGLGQIATSDPRIWHTIARFDEPEGVMTVKVTSFHSPLTVRIKANDRAGNLTVQERTVWLKDLLHAPTVTLLSPAKGSPLRGGEHIDIRYRVEWQNASVHPVNLSYTVDGQTWHSILQDGDNTGTCPWQVPQGDFPGLTLRLEARGKGNRQLVDTTGPITVDSTAPMGIILGPGTLHDRHGDILVSVQDSGPAPTGIDKMAIFASRDGDTQMIKAAETYHIEKSVPVKLPGPGLYNLWIVCTDKAGNSSSPPPIPRPFLVRVRSKDESIQLLNFTDKTVLRGGSSHYLSWRLDHFKAPPISGRILLYDGKALIPLTDVDPLAEKVLFTLPDRAVSDGYIQLAIKTANQDILSTQSHAFNIDADCPAVKITKGSVKDDVITLDYQVEDFGAAGVKSARLYRSNDGGRTWTADQALDLSGTITVPVLPGFNSFYITAMDGVGNETAGPEQNSPPDITLAAARFQPDDVVLNNFTGGETVRGGSTHYVFWTCRYADAILNDRPGILSLSTDGGATYKTVAEGLPATGKHPIAIPAVNDLRLRLKIAIQTPVGRMLTRTSESDIRVDAVPPFITILSPIASRERKTMLKVDGAGENLADLEAIEVYARSSPLDSWLKIPHTQKRNTLTVRLSDGVWSLFAAGRDKVGNESMLPGQGKQGFTLLVDTVPPALAGKRTPAASRLKAGTKVKYNLEMHDANPAPFSLRVETQMGPQELYWQERTHHYPVAEPYTLILPDTAGTFQAKFTIEDMAGNKSIWTDMVQVFVPDPAITCKVLGKPVFAGKGAITIAWSAEYVSRDSAITFAISPDGEQAWEPIGEASGDTGEQTFTLPNTINSKRTYLKATLSTPSDKPAEHVLGPFTVSSAAPQGIIYGTLAPAPPK